MISELRTPSQQAVPLGHSREKLTNEERKYRTLKKIDTLQN